MSEAPASGLGSLFFGAQQHILLISPQRWDSLKVSKHHYAAEVARLGHRVSFLEPPVLGGRPGELSRTGTEIPGLTRVSYTPWLPYQLKFHARSAFDWMMRRQAGRIADHLGCSPTVVWDFDNSYQFSDLRPFGAAFNIFHAVDQPANGRRDAKFADLLLSVSETFLDLLSPQGGHVIPHALSPAHLAHAKAVTEKPCGRPRGERPLTVGYVGNLEHVGVDWPTIRQMVRQYPDVRFRFIGPYSDGRESRTPRLELAAARNCEFLGPMPAAEVLRQAHEIDVWLVCYDPAKTADGAINSHKVLEYLATGHPVLSNRLAAYADCDLVQMPASPSNDQMPKMLGSTLSHLAALNSATERRRRAAFASQFTYAENLRRIDGLAQAVLRTKLFQAAAPDALRRGFREHDRNQIQRSTRLANAASNELPE